MTRIRSFSRTRTADVPGWIAAGLGAVALLLGLFCLAGVRSLPGDLANLLVPAFGVGTVLGVVGLALGIAVAKEEPRRIGAHLGIWFAALGGLAGAGAIVSGLLLWADAWGF